MPDAATVHFKVPFMYDVRYRRYRGRRIEETSLIGHANVAIEEVPSPDSPAFIVAGNCPLTHSRNAWWQRFRYFGERAGRVWRLPDGLFAEFCSIDEFEERVVKCEDNPFAADRAGVFVQPFWAETKPLMMAEDMHRRLVISWFEDTTSDPKAEAIVHRAASMRIVDEMVCVAVTEPVLAVHVGADTVCVAPVECAGQVRDGFSIRTDVIHGRRYRHDRLAEAREYAATLASETGRTLLMDFVLEAADGTSSRLAQEGEHLWMLADALYEAVRHFDEKSADTNEVFGLGDALMACPKRHSTAPLADAIERFLNYLEAALPDSFTDAGLSSRLFALGRQARRDLAAWRGRSQNVDDWSDEALQLPADFRIEQLLSGLALREAAMALRVQESMLEDLRSTNLALLSYRPWDGPYANKDFVIAIGHDLSVVRTMGAFGRPVPEVIDDRLTRFLATNRDRENEASALSSLDIAW
jgi:predicted DCC family thiol-disulfide oxidoreductase YuxK